MDRVDAISLFVRVVDSGSFSAVARTLGVGQPAVSKQIAALEAGAGQATIDRLASQARAWLDELDPMRNTRFASTR